MGDGGVLRTPPGLGRNDDGHGRSPSPATDRARQRLRPG
ncbi:hypothetical protein SERN_0791 [Serinibacter arcticus]|uniref:Uncharacterized protein n=1 Tax=Serinibacter arcticus TaxID=1655435 RepID=A0A4Z1E625_9MICO|nr:hypothetical protein SERN_0791 [Serinibacter arcticus]